jgi:hypothetical protein
MRLYDVIFGFVFQSDLYANMYRVISYTPRIFDLFEKQSRLAQR